MKLKSIVLSVICMLMLVGCAEDSSSEKSKTTSTTPTTTTAHEDISFEATVIDVTSEGYVHFVDIDADLDGSGQKVGKARLDYDIDSVDVSDGIKNGDKVKITTNGEIGLGESVPPVVFGIKKIEKIGESKDISFEATVIKADDGYITLVDAELSYGNGEKVGESRLECDDSVEIPSDIEEGDKLKVTVGQDFSIIETGPPIITNIKSIEKIS